MQEISKIIFDEMNAEKVVEEYYKYHTSFDEESINTLKQLNASLEILNKKIDNIVAAVANTGSSALLSSLQNFENEREKIKMQISVKVNRIKRKKRGCCKWQHPRKI